MNVKAIQAAIKHLKNGGLAIIADDEDREAEGDLLGLASKVTPEKINFITQHARGLLCVPMAPETAKRLGITLMTADNTEPFGTAFTISVDAKSTSTGISAFDRATTIKQLANPKTAFDDFYHPGHIFPLIARPGGVKERNGHTEAAVDLARLAGEEPVAYICEILSADGHMARQPELKRLAAEYDLSFLTIKDLQEYLQTEASKPLATVELPSEFGNFRLRPFEDGTIAIRKGTWTTNSSVLVRLHSECFTGDVLGSMRCDCGQQLQQALKIIERAGQGVVLYLPQEGRGIGLLNKLRAYKLQEQGLDTVQANEALGFADDERNYQSAAHHLKELGIFNLRLLTNNPDKIQQLQQYQLNIVERIPLEIPAQPYDQHYLETKKEKFHHLLKLGE